MGGGGKALPKSAAGDAVTAAINEIGFGKYQLVTLLLTGGIMFAEGAEMLVMGSITSLLHDAWDLNPAVRGAMVSVVFIGFSIGNLMSGSVGDRHGRRVAILLSYSMIGCFGFATACSTGPFTMIGLRFFVGMGCGIGFPAVYSLMPEVCPAEWRGGISTLMIGFMPLGELVAALFVLFVDPELNNSAKYCSVGIYYPTKSFLDPERCVWRTLCELSAVPAFIFLMLSSHFLHESPQFLAAQGRWEELEESMLRIAKMNGKEINLDELRASFLAGSPASKKLDDINKDEAQDGAEEGYSFSSALVEMAAPKLRYVVIFMCFAHMTKDFSVFGLSYVLPQFFVFLKSMKAAYELIIVACLALPGVALAFAASRVEGVSRATWMSISSGLCGLFGFGMLSSAPMALAAPSAYIVKLLALSYFIFTVVYTAEAFPTSIRNTAVGCCTCAGRMGSIGAPLVFELSKAQTGSFDFFLYCLIGSMLAISSSATVCLPKKGLMDGASEEEAEILNAEKLAGMGDYSAVKSSA
eukprot:TRINITY_DN99348_c0_g1_i1.p1 TRINITY_DN99348_c0_g1~~TRINITY_DN99348_c0_g1_i1.p1  ORF type:complete len:525 (+),score=104.71 TRINITY_DN99348_c0_g1_i1:142-1716(+)